MASFSLFAAAMPLFEKIFQPETSGTMLALSLSHTQAHTSTHPHTQARIQTLATWTRAHNKLQDIGFKRRERTRKNDIMLI